MQPLNTAASRNNAPSFKDARISCTPLKLEQHFVKGAGRETLELLEAVPKTLRSNTAILFVHGHWCNASTSLNTAINCATIGMPAFSLSLHGSGSSENHSPISLQKDQDDVHAVIEKLASAGFKQIVLFGHSYGGYLCQELLGGRYIDAVKGLVLANSLPPEGPLQANLRFLKIAKLEGALCYVSCDGALKPELARSLLFNHECLPQGIQLDRARRLPNFQSTLGLSEAKKSRLKIAFGTDGKILVIHSDRDRVITSPDSIMSTYNIEQDNLVRFSTHHMGVHFAFAERTAQHLSDFALTVRAS